MAFLNKVGDRQTIMSESNRQCDHEPHMGLGKLMHRTDIAIVFPAPCENLFLVACQKRRGHRSSYELPADSRELHHRIQRTSPPCCSARGAVMSLTTM